MKTSTGFSPATSDAGKLLGLQVAEGRRARQWTAADLAERVGVSTKTLYKIERGDPSVALGTAFEAAVLVGVPLFGLDRDEIVRESKVAELRLALLPKRIRTQADIDVDF